MTEPRVPRVDQDHERLVRGRVGTVIDRGLERILEELDRLIDQGRATAEDVTNCLRLDGPDALYDMWLEGLEESE